MTFKLALTEHFPCREYSVVDNDGFIAGQYNQYVANTDRRLPFIRPASFMKVEALKLIEKLNDENI